MCILFKCRIHSFHENCLMRRTHKYANNLPAYKCKLKNTLCKNNNNNHSLLENESVNNLWSVITELYARWYLDAAGFFPAFSRQKPFILFNGIQIYDVDINALTPYVSVHGEINQGSHLLQPMKSDNKNSAQLNFPWFFIHPKWFSTLIETRNRFPIQCCPG